jgi:hypothetical protein
MADRAARLALAVGAQGAIVTTNGRGQRFVETILTVQALERAGVSGQDAVLAPLSVGFVLGGEIRQGFAQGRVHVARDVEFLAQTETRDSRFKGPVAPAGGRSFRLSLPARAQGSPVSGARSRGGYRARGNTERGGEPCPRRGENPVSDPGANAWSRLAVGAGAHTTAGPESCPSTAPGPGRAQEGAAEMLQRLSGPRGHRHIGVQREPFQASTTGFVFVHDGGRRTQTACGMTGARTAGEQLLEGGGGKPGEPWHLFGDRVGGDRVQSARSPRKMRLTSADWSSSADGPVRMVRPDSRM